MIKRPPPLAPPHLPSALGPGSSISPASAPDSGRPRPRDIRVLVFAAGLLCPFKGNTSLYIVWWWWESFRKVCNWFLIIFPLNIVRQIDRKVPERQVKHIRKTFPKLLPKTRHCKWTRECICGASHTYKKTRVQKKGPGNLVCDFVRDLMCSFCIITLKRG